MLKPDERVLVALNTLDRSLVEWLTASLAQLQNDLIDAAPERMPRIAGGCEVLRDILNSTRGAHDALQRIRS